MQIKIVISKDKALNPANPTYKYVTDYFNFYYLWKNILNQISTGEMLSDFR